MITRAARHILWVRKRKEPIIEREEDYSSLLPQKGKEQGHGGAVSSRVCVGYLFCLSLLPAPEEVRKLVF